MTNSGQFKYHLGFHIRRSGSALEVRYNRQNANLWLPRSFRWSDVAAIEDLHRYINGLVNKRDTKFVRYCENNGYVSDIHQIKEPLSEAQKPLSRASITWLAGIANGQESLTLPENTTITLRTDRNGYSATSCAKQLVDTGILSRVETQGKPLEFEKRCPPNERMIISFDRDWTLGIYSPLRLDHDEFIWNGYFFTAKQNYWHAHALIPNRIGYPTSFNFKSNDWDKLGHFLNAIQLRKNITVKRLTSHSHIITDVDYPEQSPTSRAIQVSPQRLRAILRCEDPLQLTGDDLFSQRHYRNRCYPWRIDSRLLDQRLDSVHDRVIAARQRNNLSTICPQPFSPLDKNPYAFQSPQTIAHALKRSGSNLLCYDYLIICNERAGLEAGCIANAAPLGEPIINCEDLYAQYAQLVDWPPNGHGHMCTLIREGLSFWLGWQPLSADRWFVLAQNPAVIDALRLISNIDIDSRMAQFVP